MGPIDWEALYQISSDQSVVGLVAAGIEQISDMKVTKPMVLPFLKKVFAIETRNGEMDLFVAELFSGLYENGIQALLVKGQGVSKCYARPLWRSAGDVDLVLDDVNYQKAKVFLKKYASSVETERAYTRHLGMSIGQYEVELHGTLRIGLSHRADKVLDELQKECCSNGSVRLWSNNGVKVKLPSPTQDVLFVFTHFLKHFYVGGIGLRQICDWCRLLWTYREEIDRGLLESRLRQMGLMTEWKAFGAFVVDWLGMPVEAMPFYDPSPRWSRKAKRICSFILKVGNFGKNRDMSYYQKYPFFIRKAISLGQRLGDLARHAMIFPMDSFRFLPNILAHGFRSAAHGE